MNYFLYEKNIKKISIFASAISFGIFLSLPYTAFSAEKTWINPDLVEPSQKINSDNINKKIKRNISRIRPDAEGQNIDAVSELLNPSTEQEEPYTNPEDALYNLNNLEAQTENVKNNASKNFDNTNNINNATVDTLDATNNYKINNSKINNQNSSDDLEVEIIDKTFEDKPEGKQTQTVKSKKNSQSEDSISTSEIEGGGQFETAVFAGGAFWNMQPIFNDADGVSSTTVGFTGGQKPTPSYDDVSSGKSGHFEAIQIIYDPAKTTYDKLLKIYLHNINPYDANGQFCDVGSQFKPAIFYTTDAQKTSAENIIATELAPKPIAPQIDAQATNQPAQPASTQQVNNAGAIPSADVKTAQNDGTQPKTVAIQVLQYKAFYPAEQYHQNYYKNNALLYNIYKQRCGRSQGLFKIWGKNK